MSTQILSIDDHWWVANNPLDKRSLVLQQRYTLNLNTSADNLSDNKLPSAIVGSSIDPLVIRHKQSLSARTFKSHAWRPMGAIVVKQNSQQSMGDFQQGHICRERPWRPNSGHVQTNSTCGGSSGWSNQALSGQRDALLRLSSDISCLVEPDEEEKVENHQLTDIEVDAPAEELGGEQAGEISIVDTIVDKEPEMELEPAQLSEPTDDPPEMSQQEETDGGEKSAQKITEVVEEAPIAKPMKIRFKLGQEGADKAEMLVKKQLEEKMSKLMKPNSLLNQNDSKNEDVIEPSLKDDCMIHYQDPFEFICRVDPSHRTVYEYQRALPLDWSKMFFKDLARQGLNWRHTKEGQSVEMSHLEEQMLDRIHDMIKWEVQTEIIERGRRDILRVSSTATGTERSPSQPAEPANTKQTRKNLNCCRSCLQPACAGDCPNKTSRPRLCKTCRQIYCYGTCNKIGFVFQERVFHDENVVMEHAEAQIIDKPRVSIHSRPTPRPQSCESCNPRRQQLNSPTVNVIKANDIVLKKPRINSATFSRAMQCSTIPVDLRRTKVDACSPVPSLLLQEFERAQLSPYRPSRPTSAVTGRNALLPGKTFKSNRRLSLKPPLYAAVGPRIRSATMRSSLKSSFADIYSSLPTS